MQRQPSLWTTNLLGLSSALQGYIDIPSVNQGLNEPGHRSSNYCNGYVYIFDCFQLRLRPDHTATPTICTKHRNYPDLLDVLSPRTYRQPSLRHSTAPTFSTTKSTQTPYCNSDSTPMHTFVYNPLNKNLIFNLIH